MSHSPLHKKVKIAFLICDQPHEKTLKKHGGFDECVQRWPAVQLCGISVDARLRSASPAVCCTTPSSLSSRRSTSTWIWKSKATMSVGA